MADYVARFVLKAPPGVLKNLGSDSNGDEMHLYFDSSLTKEQLINQLRRMRFVFDEESLWRFGDDDNGH